MGNGMIVSLNYDRRLHDAFSVRVGAGFYVADSGQYPNTATVFVPTAVTMAHYFIGEGNHKLELGAGIAWQLRFTACETYSPPLSCTLMKPTLLVGYRFQQREGGMVFRAGFTPVVYEAGIYWGAGISVGWGF